MKYRDPSTGQFKDLHVKVSDTVPIGASMEWNGSTPPEGWLVEDGSAVSRTVYSALFAVIGTTYGAGDGVTTFNLPDHRNRVGVGLDANDSDFNAIGKKLGSKSNTYDLTHKHTQGATGSTTLTINQIPSHTHGYRDYYTTDITTSVQTRTCVAISLDGSYGGAGTMATGGGQGHTHTNPDTANALGNTAISTIQQSIVTNYIIKAYQVVAAPAKVTNQYSESNKEVYSADYVNNVLSSAFPIGKTEIFFDNEDHSNYLGFTWERIAQGKTLVGIDSTDSDFDTIGEFGGSKTHKHLSQTGVVGADNEKYLYGILDSQGYPAYGSQIISNVKRATVNPVDVESDSPVRLAYTNNESSLQPYVVVAYWRRVS